VPASPRPVVLEWEHRENQEGIIVHHDDCEICADWANHYSADLANRDYSLLLAIDCRNADHLNLENRKTKLQLSFESLEDKYHEAQRELMVANKWVRAVTEENNDLNWQLVHILTLTLDLDTPSRRTHPRHAPSPIVISPNASPPPPGPAEGPSPAAGRTL
jgi:hypothetical protein